MPQSVHLEWGKEAIIKHSEASVFVIIDILSFSTCVDIALSQKAIIFPYPYKIGSNSAYSIPPQNKNAHDFAKQHQALLAGPREG